MSSASTRKEAFAGLRLSIQGQRRGFEIGKNGGPTLFTQRPDCCSLSGLPRRGEFLDLFSAFGRNGQFHAITMPAAEGLYEAIPLAFIAEQAGGCASDGRRNILDIQPESLHQRTPLFIGSRDLVEKAVEFIGTYDHFISA